VKKNKIVEIMAIVKKKNINEKIGNNKNRV